MKKVIVFASFGVADAKARAKRLDAVALQIGRSFRGYSVVQAYTSHVIRARMIKQGFRALAIAGCLSEVSDGGCEEVYLQPSHVTAGEEYENKILKVAKDFKSRFKVLKVGEPLLYADEDYKNVLTALTEGIGREEDEEILLAGHGSPHRHNPAYEKLQAVADEMKLPVTVGVLEQTDTPSFEDAVVHLKEKNAKKILLAPFLVGAGIHATRDMAGDEPTSWKNRLTAEGFSLRVDMRSLTEYDAIRNIYMQKIAKLTGEKLS